MTLPAAAIGTSSALEDGREVLRAETAALSQLAAGLDARFVHAVEMILATRGRLIVSGIGKSGHIGRK
ncbi:hypothetical protein ACFFRS_27305, partial [Saccharopolyspora hordei]